ncbi:dihydrofolate reductase [Stemphylium lycopersici]|nr:dihydrofolate reductase [Stemphylium lycopersici]
MSDEQPSTHLDTTSTLNENSLMPPKPPTLTLILAATPSLGIGKDGVLPWPQLKKEMGFFARVTKRTTPSLSTDGSRKINAVLMGRKTWESIPPKFRPLKDRLNIVITSSPEDFTDKLDKKTDVEGPMVCSGIVDAITQLERQDKTTWPSQNLEFDKIFVIGGASIYRTALELPQTKRVLLTKIQKEFECDTFFSVNLEEAMVWKKAGKEKLEEFTGEEVADEGIEEQGVRFQFHMYERE